MDIYMQYTHPKGGLHDILSREIRDQSKSVLLDITHTYPQIQRYLRGGSAELDGPAAATSEARKSANTELADRRGVFRRAEAYT